MKIQTKILLPLSLLCSLAAVGVFFLAKTQMEESLTKQIFLTTQSAAEAKKNSVSDILSDEMGHVVTLSKNSVFREYLTAYSLGDYQYQKQAETEIEQITRSYDDFDRIYLLNNKGKTILSSDPFDQNIVIESPKENIGADMDPYFSGIFYSSSTNEYYYSIAAPVMSVSEYKITGIIVAQFKTDRLYSVVGNVSGLGKSGESFLVDRNKYILSPLSLSGGKKILIDKIETKNTDRCYRENNEMMEFFDYRGVMSIGTASAIPIADWCIIVKMDKKEAFQPVSDNLRKDAIFYFGGILFFVCAGYFVLRKTLRPIENLLFGIGIVTSGDFSYKVGTDSTDEIGELSRAIDKLSVKINESSVSVQEQVKKQTNEIIEQKKHIEDREAAILNVYDDIKSIKANYQEFLENSRDGVVILNKELAVIWVNVEAGRILEVSRGENKHQAFTDLVAPEFFERMKSYIQSVFSGEKIAGEIEIISTSGKKYLVDIAGRKTTFEGRTVALIQMRDISEKRKAENLLKESEAKYSALYESSKDAIMILEPPGWNFTHANRATLELFNVESREEFEKLGPWDISPEFQPDQRRSDEKAKEMIEKAMERGGNFFEWTHNKYKGDPFFATVLLAKIPINGKDVLQATVRDVSTEKNAKIALQNEKVKLEKYFEMLSSFVVILDEKGGILLVNKNAADALGYKQSDFVGKNWLLDFAEKVDGFDHSRFLRESSDKTGIEYFEHPIKDTGGKDVHIAWGRSTMRNTSGGIDAFLLVGENITALRKAEANVVQLKEVDTIKDEFLNIAAHELKTPLTAIIGLSDILRSLKVLPPEMAQFPSIINGEGIRLSHIVKQILTVTRYESGKETAKLESISISEYLQTLLPSLEMVVKAKNGHIVVEEKSETAKINTDKEKLTEVLMNLVDNALKYGNDGQTITITAFRVEKGNLRIEVSDQGQGISAKKVSRLFNKFSQLEPSLSRSQEGIGLGLYVCKLIVEKMGGQIGVESEEGKGTKFFLIFPVLSE